MLNLISALLKWGVLLSRFRKAVFILSFLDWHEATFPLGLSKLAMFYQNLWSWANLLQLSFLGINLSELLSQTVVLLVISPCLIQRKNVSTGLCFENCLGACVFYLPWCWVSSLVLLKWVSAQHSRPQSLLKGPVGTYYGLDQDGGSDLNWAAQYLHGHTRADSTAPSAQYCSFLECFPRQVILLVELDEAGWAVISTQWALPRRGSFLSFKVCQECGSTCIQPTASLVLYIRDTGL